MRRFAPLLLAVTVTPLILGYGKHGWGWAMPLVLAAVLWLLDRKAREPSEPAPAHSAHSEPAPVD